MEKPSCIYGNPDCPICPGGSKTRHTVPFTRHGVTKRDNSPLNEPMKITILGRPVTAKNSAQMVINRGRRFLVKKPALQRWEREALPQVKSQMAGEDFDPTVPVNLTIEVWPYIDGRCDLVGYCQSVQDLLVKAGVLADDSAWKPRIVVGLDGSKVMGVDKDCPRIEITLTKTV